MSRWVLYGHRAVVVQHTRRLCRPQSTQVNNQERAHGCVCASCPDIHSRLSVARSCAEPICCTTDAQVFAMRGILGAFFCVRSLVQGF